MNRYFQNNTRTRHSSRRTNLIPILTVVAVLSGLLIFFTNEQQNEQVFESLMPKSTPLVKFSSGSIENPGLFTYTNTKPRNAGKRNKDHYRGKVVILLNKISQSAAEFHAMAYRVHPNTTVIGSTTAGADGNISRFYSPGGISTMIIGIGVYYSDGKETQRIGIIPDVEVKQTNQGIKEGRDELMGKAIEIINGQ